MINSQKFIITVLFINLIMGMTGIVTSSNFTNEDIFNYFGSESEQINNQTKEYKSYDDYAGVKTTLDEENTIGSAIKQGKTIKNFWDHLINFFWIPTSYDNNIERAMILLINLFRSILNILLIIEIYMFFKNKKVS